MSQITPIDQMKLRAFANREGAEIAEECLRSAANGDEVAIQALQQGTRLSRETIQEAAAMYLSGGLDAVFAAGSAKHAKLIGTQPAGGPTLPAPAATTPSKSGPTAAELQNLGKNLRPVVDELKAAEQQQPRLETAAKQASKTASENKTWKLWGDAAKKEDATKQAAQNAVAAVAAGKRHIRELQIDVDGYLNVVLEKTSPEYRALHRPLMATADLQMNLDVAIATVEASLSAVGRAKADENWEHLWGGKDFFIPGIDGDRGGNALSRSQAAVESVNNSIGPFNTLNPKAQVAKLTPIPDIESGAGVDNMLDIGGSVLRTLTQGTEYEGLGQAADAAASHGGSIYVSTQLGKMERELSSRLGVLKSMYRAVDRQGDSLGAQVRSVRADLKRQALEAAAQ